MAEADTAKPAPAVAALDPPADAPAAPLERFAYDDRSVALFVWATIIWGIVGMLVGVIIAFQLAGMGSTWWPWLNHEWLSFGRLRPLHTNAVIFAFTGNAIFAGCYYASQRLLKARLWSDKLTRFHFWGWQGIIVAAAITLPLGITTSKEYAELEWPIDLAITLVWIAFSANLIGTIWQRRERHLYVAIWFFLATCLGIAILHVVNSLAVPAGWLKSYSVFAGQQDALVQWWYGHNAVAFFLTTPILGLMYYYLPKAAGRPIFSYRLSIVHFWSLVFIYIWAGPHHLLHTSLPDWAQSLGVAFSIMLWAPSWGGMINGLLTLRGAFDKVRRSPVLKFFVVAITFYGMSTFEGPMMSLRSVNALSHNTDWTIAHVHSGALGWVGFLVFGMLYWLVPRLYRTKLWSDGLADLHFWIGTVGIVIYVVAMWIAGLTEGSMWFQFTDDGRLMYQDWIEIFSATEWMQFARAGGGTFYLIGAILCIVNLIRTARAGEKLEDEAVEAPALMPDRPPKELIEETYKPRTMKLKLLSLHGLVERWPFVLIVLTTVSLAIGGAMEIIPHLIQGALSPRIATVTPYTARYGDSQLDVPAYTRAGEQIYDRPFLWGSKRTGPDLAREGLLKPGPSGALWHYMHMSDPHRTTSEGSIMPGYPHLYSADMDLSDLSERLRALAGPPIYTPYTEEEIREAEALARAAAADLAATLREQLARTPDYDAPEQLADKEIVALIAYLQRLGVDISKEAP